MAEDSPYLVTTTATLGERFSCHATHQPSGATMNTAAPKDNNGDGSSFSPTDLVGVALGTCMLTIMAIKARQKGWDLGEATVTTTKRMSPPPRQIAELVCTFQLPASLDEQQRTVLRTAAESCPVKRSLDPSVEIKIVFETL